LTGSSRAAARTATLRAVGVAGVIAFCSLLAPTGDTATGAGDDRALDAAAFRTSQAAIGRVIGDVELTDQHGRRLRLAELRGRPLVLSLVYTNCYYVCSGLTLHLRDAVRLARDTLGAGRFSVLTVGFDAQHDTPARMLAYARDRGIEGAEWRFASADAATIGRLADEVGFTWAASPRGFDHIAQVTIVDADGRVVQQIYGQDFPPPQLVDPLKSLVLARGLDRSTVQGVLDTVQLFCAVYDPASGRYAFDYSMIVSALPALLVLGMVAAAIVVAGRRNR
jgi:protein SCO1/2